jgi:hypothetical protein
MGFFIIRGISINKKPEEEAVLEKADYVIHLAGKYSS